MPFISLSSFHSLYHFTVNTRTFCLILPSISMANSAARHVFEVSKTSDIVLFMDKRPVSALDLLTLFALRRYAVDPTRTAVHVLSFERRTQLWQERLALVQKQDRLFIYDLSRSILNELPSELDAIVEDFLQNVAKFGSTVSHHVVIFDSTSLLLVTPIRDFCALIVGLSDLISKATSGMARTSIGLLHHTDIFDHRSERALRSISTSTVTVSSAAQNKLGQQEFICTVEHLRHLESHVVKTEKITLSDDWQPIYSAANSLKTARPSVSKSDAAADPASNLSFNLRLTSEERTARDQVLLPHSRGGSVIYYEPDEADDIDYEDPDE